MALDTPLDDEYAVWARFVRERRHDDREALIGHYESHARILAAKYYAQRQIREIEFDEFRQYAMVGLVESIDRYDPRENASFKTFSGHRIRGAILNGIEKYCEKQQQITARSRLREERFESLLNEVTACQQDPFLRMVDTTIGAAIGYMLEDSGMYQNGEDSYEHNIYRSREMSDLVRVLSSLIDTLPSQEQMVIRYHYLQQIRFDEIARKMNLTKGRISQIHHKALQRMRQNYEQLRLLRTDY